MKSTVTNLSTLTATKFPVTKIWTPRENGESDAIVMFSSETTGVYLGCTNGKESTFELGIVSSDWVPCTEDRWRDFTGTIELNIENGR
jgi:hypothetical protein